MTKTNQAFGALQIVMAVADAIKDLKSVPSGELYARLMAHMSLESYNSVIGVLERTGLITVKSHLITWVG